MTAVSGRMVRSILRSLREVVGEAGYEAILAPLPDAVRRLAGGPHDWVPVEEWLPVIGAFEERLGDLSTWQLTRQATRLALAVAIGKAWSASLADISPDVLLERADSFWKLSYNTGRLVVVSKKPRHVVLAIEGWPSPPAPVSAMVAETCAVFLARLGERAPRAIDRISDGRAEIDITW
jgi:hypothetical protein